MMKFAVFASVAAAACLVVVCGQPTTEGDERCDSSDVDLENVAKQTTLTGVAKVLNEVKETTLTNVSQVLKEVKTVVVTKQTTLANMSQVLNEVKQTTLANMAQVLSEVRSVKTAVANINPRSPNCDTPAATPQLNTNPVFRLTSKMQFTT